ncbi:hypothetical protein [Serratia marcescens]|uniref:hypothetical protein n=1 Tax=Serratia marcescens TaxID=615 RepID=UPI0027E51B88|nr:hypothetical protein [Serratia marcescens]MDI3229256.1 hypothetical protein [Serratia marcescens]
MTTIKRFTPDYKMHAVRFEAFAREAEHGEYVKFDAHQRAVSALEAEHDALADRVNALAVESKTLSDALSLISRCYKHSPHIQSMCVVETPATDAALAAIKKQAGIEAVEEAAYSLYGKGCIFDTIMDYATELREAK